MGSDDKYNVPVHNRFDGLEDMLDVPEESAANSELPAPAIGEAINTLEAGTGWNFRVFLIGLDFPTRIMEEVLSALPEPSGIRGAVEAAQRGYPRLFEDNLVQAVSYHQQVMTVEGWPSVWFLYHDDNEVPQDPNLFYLAQFGHLNLEVLASCLGISPDQVERALILYPESWRNQQLYFFQQVVDRGDALLNEHIVNGLGSDIERHSLMDDFYRDVFGYSLRAWVQHAVRRDSVRDFTFRAVEEALRRSSEWHPDIPEVWQVSIDRLNGEQIAGIYHAIRALSNSAPSEFSAAYEERAEYLVGSSRLHAVHLNISARRSHIYVAALGLNPDQFTQGNDVNLVRALIIAERQMLNFGWFQIGTALLMVGALYQNRNVDPALTGFFRRYGHLSQHFAVSGDIDLEVLSERVERFNQAAIDVDRSSTTDRQNIVFHPAERHWVWFLCYDDRSQ